MPQVYNARRFDVPLDPFPKIARIDAACAAIKAFADAGPEAPLRRLEPMKEETVGLLASKRTAYSAPGALCLPTHSLKVVSA